MRNKFVVNFLFASYLLPLFSNIYIFIFTLYQLLLLSSVFAYSGGRVFSYFTDNALLNLLMQGGYYTLGVLAILIILMIFFKFSRIIIVSFGFALFTLYLLILIYEMIEKMSWASPL